VVELKGFRADGHRGLSEISSYSSLRRSMRSLRGAIGEIGACPCRAHIRGNVGELDMAIATLREIGIELPTRCRFAASPVSVEPGRRKREAMAARVACAS
jgi:hypothetical protein